MYYKQCKFQKGNTFAYAWIPEKYAHTGRVVRFKIDGNWFDGYRVVDVFQDRRDEQDAVGDSQDYEHQREASDI